MLSSSSWSGFTSAVSTRQPAWSILPVSVTGLVSPGPSFSIGWASLSSGWPSTLSVTVSPVDRLGARVLDDDRERHPAAGVRDVRLRLQIDDGHVPNRLRAAAHQEERSLGLDLLALGTHRGRLSFPPAALHVAEQVDLFRGPLRPAECRDRFGQPAKEVGRLLCGLQVLDQEPGLVEVPRRLRPRGDGPVGAGDDLDGRVGRQIVDDRRADSLARSSRVFAPSRAFMLYERSMTKTASTASPRLPA